MRQSTANKIRWHGDKGDDARRMPGIRLSKSNDGRPCAVPMFCFVAARAREMGMKFIRVALAALAMGTSAAAIAAPADGPNPRFTGSDLFSLSAASDPQISPDGRWIAYV